MPMSSIQDKNLEYFYALQEKMRRQARMRDELPNPVRYVAGVDVAYRDADNTMIGAIVVLEAQSLEVVTQAHHQMDITFPYVPGLFSFREIPAIKAAYQQLETKPDLIVCDAQGIAHPRGVGMATHLGIELDISTIGCAKKRLVGEFELEKLGTEKGAFQPLIMEQREVGVALRTRKDVKPMYVSVGHKIRLETAISWVLRLCSDYRLPETTRQADQLVNRLLREI